MERTHIYPTLAEALVDRGTDPATIDNFGQLWDSITWADRLPCPLCFTYAAKHSALKPLPQEDRKKPMHCEVCLAVFYLPDSRLTLAPGENLKRQTADSE